MLPDSDGKSEIFHKEISTTDLPILSMSSWLHIQMPKNFLKTPRSRDCKEPVDQLLGEAFGLRSEMPAIADTFKVSIFESHVRMCLSACRLIKACFRLSRSVLIWKLDDDDRSLKIKAWSLDVPLRTFGIILGKCTTFM